MNKRLVLSFAKTYETLQKVKKRFSVHKVEATRTVKTFEVSKSCIFN
jgi:hypothetical protein